MTVADIAMVIEETIGLRPGSVSAAEAYGIVDLEAFPISANVSFK